MKPADEGISGLALLKLAVSLLSVCALFLFVFGPLPLVLNATSQGASLPPRYVFFYIFPLLHLPYCILSCTRFLRSYGLIASGILMHGGLVLWMFIGSSFNVGVGLVFTALWVLLSAWRIKDERAAV